MNNGTQVLPIDLGKREDGFDLNVDLARLPNLLVGGARGQGKTNLLNGIITSLAEGRSDDEVNFILLDHAYVEFGPFWELPHLRQPVVNSVDDMIRTFEGLDAEVERRLQMFAKARCRNLSDFNARVNPDSDGLPKTVPYIVVVADDMSELMADHGAKVTKLIRRLTSRSRAAGMHLILSLRNMDQVTMSVFTLDSFPARIAFRTWSVADSMALIGVEEAAQLSKPGEFLFRCDIGKTIRCQAKKITVEEIDKMVRRKTHTDFKIGFFTSDKEK